MAIETINLKKNYLKFRQASGTKSSVDWSIDTDGVITLNGTSDGTTSNAYTPISYNITLPAGNYTLTSLNQNDKTITQQLYISYQDGSGTEKGTGGLDAKGTTNFTLTQQTTVKVYLFFYGGNTYNNVKMYPMVIEGTYNYTNVPSFIESTGRLPQAYEEVEHITSDGNQLINTNVKLATNSKYQFEIMFTSNDDIRWFGNYQSSSNSLVLAFKNGYIPCRVNQQWDDNYLNTISLNEKHLIEVETSGTGVKIYCDGTLHKQVSIAYSPNTNLNIGLIKEVSLTKEGLIGNLYNCKISTDNNLVRDFVPGMRKSDNVYGMYDLVNNVFYTNSGTGTLKNGVTVVGYDIQKCKVNILTQGSGSNLPAGYQEVEWIKGNIDTGEELEPKNITETYEIVLYMEGYNNGYFFSNDKNSSYCRLGLRFLNNVYKMWFYFGTNNNTSANYAPLENKKIKIQLTKNAVAGNGRMEASCQYYDENGTLLGTNSTYAPKETVDSWFTTFADGLPKLVIGSGYKLYSFKKVNGKELVPCYRKSDSTVGMYDITNNTFIAATGTSEKGNDVSTTVIQPVKINILKKTDNLFDEISAYTKTGFTISNGEISTNYNYARHSFSQYGSNEFSLSESTTYYVSYKIKIACSNPSGNKSIWISFKNVGTGQNYAVTGFSVDNFDEWKSISFNQTLPAGSYQVALGAYGGAVSETYTTTLKDIMFDTKQITTYEPYGYEIIKI